MSDGDGDEPKNGIGDGIGDADAHEEDGRLPLRDRIIMVDVFADPLSRFVFWRRYVNVWIDILEEAVRRDRLLDRQDVRLACLAAAWQDWADVSRILAFARNGSLDVAGISPLMRDVKLACMEARARPQSTVFDYSAAGLRVDAKRREAKSLAFFTCEEAAVELRDALLLPRSKEEEDDWDPEDPDALRDMRALKAAFFAHADTLVGRPVVLSGPGEVYPWIVCSFE
jgi:hypothetical protein